MMHGKRRSKRNLSRIERVRRDTRRKDTRRKDTRRKGRRKKLPSSHRTKKTRTYPLKKKRIPEKTRSRVEQHICPMLVLGQRVQPVLPQFSAARSTAAQIVSKTL